MPCIKLSAARKFLARLDPSSPKFHFRTFTDNEEKRQALKAARKPDPLARNFHGSLANLAQELISQNEKGAGVFVVVNVGGQRDNEISRVRGCFADQDDGGPLVDLSGLPEPNILVRSSPKKFHIYWLVDDVAVNQFSILQKRIIAKLGTDPSVHNLSHVMRLPGFIHRKGKPFRTRAKVVHTKRYSAAELLKAFAPVPSTGVADPRVCILYQPSRAHEATDAAEAVLVASTDDIFQRGTELVHVAAIPVAGLGVPRALTAAPVSVRILSSARLLDSLSRVARCEKAKTHSGGASVTVPIDCPSIIASSLLARVGKWKFPHLRGVIQTPLLRADGSVCVSSGYDAVTQLFVAIPAGWPNPVKNPTKDDAREALKTLDALIDTFPFRTFADRSVVRSAMLTCIIRPTINAAPMHAISSPIAGSGKSKIDTICAILATGQPVAVLAWSPKSEEAEKRLGAALMRGDPVVCFDNIKSPLEGALLCSMLTQEIVAIRVLGLSKIVDIPMSATILANGNNLVVADDVTRRALVAVIDPKHENPESRRFDNDPVADALNQRTELVNACLTILRAFIRSKETPKCRPLGGYEVWSNLVRGALLWLGCADPVAVMKRTRDADPIRTSIDQLMRVWLKHFRTKGVTANRVIRKAERIRDDEHDPTLFDALEAVAVGSSGKVNAKSLGRFISQHQDRIVGKYMFVRMKTNRVGSIVWKLAKPGHD
jgi:putative DNA primase/helicase